MAFGDVASHEYDDGGTISLGTNRHDEAMIVMDGAGGLETVIRFDRVAIKHNHIELRRGSPPVVTGTLEGGPNNYGEVGEWIIQHQDQPLDLEGDA